MSPPRAPPTALPPFTKSRCHRTVSSPVIDVGSALSLGYTPRRDSSPYSSDHKEDNVQQTSELVKRVFHSEHLYDVPNLHDSEGGAGNHTHLGSAHAHTRSLDGTNSNQDNGSGHFPVANGNDLNDPKKVQTNTEKGMSTSEEATPSNGASARKTKKEGVGEGEEKRKKHHHHDANKHSVLHFLTLGKKKKKGKKIGGKKTAATNKEEEALASGPHHQGEEGRGGDPHHLHQAEEGDPMYQNVSEARSGRGGCKISSSVSCDDILGSYEKKTSVDSYYSSATPSSVPQPIPPPSSTESRHGSLTPPRPHSATDFAPSSSVYQNFTILMRDSKDDAQQQTTPTSETDSSPIYSNLSSEDQGRVGGGRVVAPPTSSSYAELVIIDQKPSFKKMIGKKPSLPLINSPNSISGPNNGISGTEERQRSRSLFPDPSSVSVSDDPVTYAPLNFKAMEAVEKMKRERADISNFDGILKRHDIREMEQRKFHT